MKKGFRKIGAVLLTIAMALAMNSTVLAVNSDGAKNNYEGIVSTDTTIGIAKSIVFVNAEGTTVREPNIVYTYTIAEAAVTDATITTLDSNNNSVTLSVKSGLLDAVESTTATVTFADTNTAAASSDGESLIKYATFEFDPTKFDAAGVYRYIITESTNVNKSSVGITEAATYKNTRYLDVYVKYTNDAHTTFGIYGYVLFEGDDGSNESIEYNDANDINLKSSGYVNTSTSASSQADVDVYTTQNLEISKVTTGALADKNNDFPVTITFTKANGLSDSIKLDYSTAGSGSLTKTGTDANSVNYVTMDNALSGTVRNGSTITITGIPTGSSVVMTETNNTVDSYQVKAGTAADSEDLLAEATVNSGATSNATSSVTINGKKEIHFTNILSEISPTGFVVRFAPYALVLICGILLIAIGLVVYNKTNKKETA